MPMLSYSLGDSTIINYNKRPIHLDGSFRPLYYSVNVVQFAQKTLNTIHRSFPIMHIGEHAIVNNMVVRLIRLDIKRINDDILTTSMFGSESLLSVAICEEFDALWQISEETYFDGKLIVWGGEVVE